MEDGSMSRSGYSDDMEDMWGFICYRGAVKSALNGKRGQAFLRELADAMDAMPEKRLIADELEVQGEFCALGVVGKCRGIDMEKLDPDDIESVAATFGIAESMAREIVYENDDCIYLYDFIDIEICGPVRPHWPDYGSHVKRNVAVPAQHIAEKRWQYMRDWVRKHLKESHVEGIKP
jgi:hypothetical protein